MTNGGGSYWLGNPLSIDDWWSKFAEYGQCGAPRWVYCLAVK